MFADTRLNNVFLLFLYDLIAARSLYRCVLFVCVELTGMNQTDLLHVFAKSFLF